VVTDIPAAQESIAGTSDPSYAGPVSPPEVDRHIPTDVQAPSRAGSFEQFASEDKTNRCTPGSHNLTPTNTSFPALPPVTVAAGIGPVVPECISRSSDHSHEPVLADTRPKLAQQDSALSAQSSFIAFSSEEEEGALGADIGRHSAGPEPSNRISAHGSFRDFSDEEVEEMQPVFGDRAQTVNQLLDNHAGISGAGNPIHPLGKSLGWGSSGPSNGHHHPVSAWPDASFSKPSTGPGPSSWVSMRPPFETQGDATEPRATAQGRRDSRNWETSTKLKQDKFLERTRRIKFDVNRPFIPLHRPFTPQTSPVGQGVTFPSSSAMPQQPTWFTPPTQAPRPGPSSYRSNTSLDRDQEMVDVDFIADSRPSPAISNQRDDAVRPSTSNTPLCSPSGSPRRTNRENLGHTSRLSSASYFSVSTDSSSDVHTTDKPHSPYYCPKHGFRGRALVANCRQGEGEGS
jgi:hypothetical protein